MAGLRVPSGRDDRLRRLLIGCSRYAPGNAGPIVWFGDILLPLLLVVLAFASRDAHERHERT
jgi:hypothetical protein